MAQFSRRHVLGLGVGALAAARLAPALADNGGGKLHGLSAFGGLKYPADFPHLAYVNPDAPKGGMFSQLVGSGGSTFNSLNAYIVKGDTASGMNLTFASLMARAFDEPDAVYLLAADELTVSPDGLVFRFRLRPGIVFHDGSEITASDVAFSLTTLKSKGHPTFSSVLRDLADVTADDKRTVQLRFHPTRGLDVPALAAAMPIFSEKYYSTRPFDETSLEAPLGSGPYRVARFEQGRYVEFERVKNWWGEKLPVSRGLYNFDMSAGRVLPGSRSRLRGLYRPQLSVPRRVHLARLGDALRFPRASRRTRQAGRHSRRASLRRAGLAAQYQAGQIWGSARSRGVDRSPSTSNGPTRT